MEREIRSSELALQEIPKAWYELSHRQHMALSALSTITLHYSNEFIFHLDALPAHVTSAALFAISTLADRYSTWKVMKANIKAEQTGIENLSTEQNIIVGEIKTPSDVVTNKRMLALDLIGTSIAAITPGAGIGFVVGKSQATANNLRIAKRTERKAEIAATLNSQPE